MRHEILRQHDTLSISISSLLLRADRAARLMFFLASSDVDVKVFISEKKFLTRNNLYKKKFVHVSNKLNNVLFEFS